ncbi:MAG: Type 1 glutamine amidotransferase-like domain-containing protein, partial [Planctomycetota bacterium]
LERGGIVGGQGAGALALCEGDGTTPGFGLFPGARLEFVSKAGKSKRKEDPPAGDGRIDWLIPKETALVVAHGRKVGAVGKADVHVRIQGTEAWPERSATITPQDVFELTDFAPYDLDLVAWRRSAQMRQGPTFPAESPAKPVLKKGTLILSGGGGVQSETWNRFIDAAGGKKATFVCIPSGSDYFPGEEPKSYGAGQLRDHGCRDVHVVDPASADRADADSRLHDLLGKATGIWIDGGRTYRVMDALEHTRAHELIRETLEEGGAVGGSSAGCQVLGELLVRGDPRTNRTLFFEGYTTGLGLLPGVVLDAHFLDRDRHEEFSKLVQEYSQYLGIGVDADTSLVVEKSTAEVLGKASVSFYDLSDGDAEPVILEAGNTYDLAKRRAKR